ncbi:Spo0E family sporulation regulatory protein-aspartic acid phosphatase [Cytobacillus sp. FJAT-54145]|uniref:Spo0E family sporulation regulatory protein-aspartic acid phosphatase n=1 Tax=Cytobacillus spartinae TaxID=3299023 RepID=A0ABW6KLH3_9BACI
MYQSTKELLDEIQKKREKMIDSAKMSGFTSDDTVRYSQELDKLIYEYQCSFQGDNRKTPEIRTNYKQMILIWPKQLVKV